RGPRRSVIPLSPAHRLALLVRYEDPDMSPILDGYAVRTERIRPRAASPARLRSAAPRAQPDASRRGPGRHAAGPQQDARRASRLFLRPAFRPRRTANGADGEGTARERRRTGNPRPADVAAHGPRAVPPRGHGTNLPLLERRFRHDTAASRAEPRDARTRARSASADRASRRHASRIVARVRQARLRDRIVPRLEQAHSP